MEKNSHEYDVALNEISFLRVPMEKILKKLRRYDFITPNVLTFGSLVCALFACGCLLVSGYVSLIVSALLIILSYLCDCADGRLARLKGLESNFGFWFDRMTDQTKLSLLLLCFGLRAYYIDGTGTYVLVATTVVIMLQLLKEFNWTIFEIFRLKYCAKDDYAALVLDTVGVTFSKRTFFRRIAFNLTRIFIFLHYEQIAVLSICPLITSAANTLYIYGAFSLISFAGRLVLYPKILQKSDEKKTRTSAV